MMPDERVTEEEQQEERVDIDALQADRDQLFDRLQRLAAEFDNFRKRNAREQAAFAERANERLVKELIPILDDLPYTVLYHFLLDHYAALDVEPLEPA